MMNLLAALFYASRKYIRTAPVEEYDGKCLSESWTISPAYCKQQLKEEIDTLFELEYCNEEGLKNNWAIFETEAVKAAHIMSSCSSELKISIVHQVGHFPVGDGHHRR